AGSGRRDRARQDRRENPDRVHPRDSPMPIAPCCARRRCPRRLSEGQECGLLRPASDREPLAPYRSILPDGCPAGGRRRAGAAISGSGGSHRVVDGVLLLASPCRYRRENADDRPARESASSGIAHIGQRPRSSHFLSDIGKDLLEAGHHQLRDGFRQIRLLPRLRAFVRQQGSHLGESIGRGREALDHWLAAKGHTPALPKVVEGIVAVRSMAQWALDYHADGRGLGFPFDLAWLDLSARCLHLLAALRTFLRTPPADAQVLKALETLERMLRPLEKDQPPFLLL